MTPNRFSHSLSVNQSSGHPVIQKSDRPWPFNKEIHHQSTSQFVKQTVWSVSQLLRLSISPSVSRTNSQPIKYPVSQLDSKWIHGSANQPVNQLVGYSAGSEGWSAMETELRIMPISAICASRPACQPVCLLYLQSCCAGPSNPFTRSFLFSLLSLFFQPLMKLLHCSLR